MTEREWLENYFEGRTGRLLEIGACDGVSESVTIGLIQRGWEAVLVEPNHKHITSMKSLYSDNNKVTIVQAAVGDNNGLAQFWDDGGGEWSTISKAHADAFSDRAKYSKHYIAAVSTMQLLLDLPGPYDLIIVDAEGLSELIFRDLMFLNSNGAEIICVEWMHGPEGPLTWLNKHYQVIAIIPPNLLVKRK